MKKRRFYIEWEKGQMGRVGEMIRLSPRESHHLIHVLRLSQGAPVLVFDAHSREMEGVVESLDPEGVAVRLTALSSPRSLIPGRSIEQESAGIPSAPGSAPKSPRIRAALALPMLKSDKLETVLRMATEIGAGSFHLFASTRSVPRLDQTSLEKKIRRWQRIIQDAVRVSGSGAVPSISLYPSLDHLLSALIPHGPVILAYEEKGFPLLSQLLPAIPLISSDSMTSLEQGGISETHAQESFQSPLTLVTGPEGGFSPEEVEKAKRCGVYVCSLGVRILRAETAPIAALAVILSYGGEI